MLKPWNSQLKFKIATLGERERTGQKLRLAKTSTRSYQIDLSLLFCIDIAERFRYQVNDAGY